MKSEVLSNIEGYNLKDLQDSNTYLIYKIYKIVLKKNLSLLKKKKKS